MKKLLSLALLGAPLMVNAAPAMNGMDITKMQRMGEEMQRCMAEIDQNEMQRLSTRAQEFERSIKALCQNGDRAGAMNNAISFAKEIHNSPSMSKMKECGDALRSMMPDLPDYTKYDNPESRKSHVCDHI